jgi:hypothetical protein
MERRKNSGTEMARQEIMVIMMTAETYRIVVRHGDDLLAVIAELPDGTTLAEAQAIYRKHFLAMADDEHSIELWRDETRH